jgi:hypothetical protein
VKHLTCKLYYQQLYLKYLCKLERYWLQAPWGWHDSVEICRSVIICEIIVHLLVIVQNNKNINKMANYKYEYYTLHLLYTYHLDMQLYTPDVGLGCLQSPAWRCFHKLYEGKSISKLQIQVATYVFELSAGNCHR